MNEVKKDTKTRITIRLEPQEIELIERIAREHNATQTDVIKAAILFFTNSIAENENN